MLRYLSFVKDQYASSMRSLKKTQTLTAAGLLLAIQMVLASYGVFEVNDSLKISLGHLALAPTAIFFGPVVAGMQGALSDILGYMIKPTGGYFPGFTLTALLGGVIYGMLLYKTRRSLWQIILARVIIMLFVNIVLNTLFLTMLYGPSRLATLPLRIFKNVVQLPIDCMLLAAVCRIVQRIPHPSLR